MGISFLPEDVLVNIFRYVVSPEGKILSVNDVYSILYTSRKFYSVGSSVELWCTVKQRCFTTKRSLELSTSSGLEVISSYNLIGKKECTKDENSSSEGCADSKCQVQEMHTRVQEMNARYRQTIQEKLIGFANCGIYSVGSEETTRIVKERSTGKKYSLKILDDDFRPYNLAAAEPPKFRTTKRGILRELALWHKLRSVESDHLIITEIKRILGPSDCNINEFRFIFGFDQYLFLPRALELVNIQDEINKKIRQSDRGEFDFVLENVHSTLLRWYDVPNKTLKDLLRGEIPLSIKKTNISTELLKCKPSELPENGSDVNVCTSITPSAVRKLLQQLLRGVTILHAHSIIHHNIEPHNLLLFESEEDSRITGDKMPTMKISDFSLCRTCQPSPSPSQNISPNLCYRAPELLMGKPCYDQKIDMWSIGCVFAEMARSSTKSNGDEAPGPIFKGRNEIDQLFKIFQVRGTPSAPWFSNMPNFSIEKFPAFPKTTKNLQDLVFGLEEIGMDLLLKLLECDPSKRISAVDALYHPYFVGDDQISSYLTSSQRLNRSFSQYLQNEFLVHRLKSMEVSSKFSVGFLFVEKHWATCVDWVVEIVDVIELSSRTIFLTMMYFDYFVSFNKNLDANKYQLAAATCLHIASKIEDVVPIGLPDLKMCADNSFSENDLVTCEAIVLEAIKDMMSFPISFDFVCLFFELPDLSRNVQAKNYARYFAELALQCNIHCKYQPSLIASCVSCLSLHFSGALLIWPPSLESLSGYNWNDIESCMNVLWIRIINIRSRFPKLNMITKRYSSERTLRVGKTNLPLDLSSLRRSD